MEAGRARAAFTNLPRVSLFEANTTIFIAKVACTDLNFRVSCKQPSNSVDVFPRHTTSRLSSCHSCRRRKLSGATTHAVFAHVSQRSVVNGSDGQRTATLVAVRRLRSHPRTAPSPSINGHSGLFRRFLGTRSDSSRPDSRLPQICGLKASGSFS